MMKTSDIYIPANLINRLRNAKYVAALTGAGISAESGIPTFREAQTGLWSKYRAEELATPDAFRRNPQLVWDWYEWRRSIISRTTPNPAHYAIAKLEEIIPGFTLITQNVDGLHQQAGSGTVRPLIELHGNIHRSRCMDNSHYVDEWEDDAKPPQCPICGSQLRPDVVWFGESLPPDELQAAIQAASECEIFLSVGTSAVVEPAASLPYIALQRDAVIVEINPENTQLTINADYSLRGSAGLILPSLCEATWPELSW